MTAAHKRYLIHFMGGMFAYVAFMLGSVSYLKDNELSAVLTGLIAITPIIPILYAMHALVIYVRSRDEFKQRIMTEALIWSSGIVGISSFTYSLLEGAVDLPQIELVWVFPALLGAHGLAECILNWKYSK